MADPFPSLWAAATPDAPPRPPLDGTVDVDLAIVGGGFTGLSTALHAQELGLKTAVLEAETVGYGASGRNNGQVIPTLSRIDPWDMVARFGRERGQAMAALVRDSAGYVFDLARRCGIDAEAEQTGWIQPAHSPGRVALARRRAEAWREIGAPVELLDRAVLAERLGTDLWFGGWRNPTGGHVNPLALARGLANAATERGALLFERSPATALRPIGERWRVETLRGAITADRVVLASNAYSDDLWPGLRRSIVPVLSWQMATEPLGPNLRATIVPGREAVSDTHGDLHFFRYDARHRLVTGGALALPFDARRRLEARIGARLARAFPALRATRFEYVWRGAIGMTRDAFPHLHAPAPGLLAWIGCNGRGLALGVVMGRELARAAKAGHADDLAIPLTALAPIPLHGIARRLAPPLRLLAFRRADAREVGA